MAKTKRKKTGGRQPGTPNKVTADIKALAQHYGPEAMETLAAIMRLSENESARVAAAKEMLDRGYGKATQNTNLTGDMTLRSVLASLGQSDAR